MLSLARCISNDHCNKDRLYLLDTAAQTKRWILSPAALEELKLGSRSVEGLSGDELDQWKLQGPIAHRVEDIGQIGNRVEAFQYLLQDRKGRGIEFGAASDPVPVPIDCIVSYADINRPDQGLNAEYPGEHVEVEHYTSLDEMLGIPDCSQDFIIASHVIEHVRHTIKALELAHRKLKSGGALVLAVPHKELTFDQPRILTQLDHFVDDYLDYQNLRDLPAIVEAFEANWILEAQRQETTYGCVETAPLAPLLYDYLAGATIDIHFHTFTVESFMQLINWFNANINQWKRTEILPHTTFEGAIEFFVKMDK